MVSWRSLPASSVGKSPRREPSRCTPFLSKWQIICLIALVVQLYIFGGSDQCQSPGYQRARGSLSRRFSGISKDALEDTDLNEAELISEDSDGTEKVTQSGLDISFRNYSSSVPPVATICELEVIGGRERDGYGAWTLCRNLLRKGGIVYSFGIGGDVSFDNDLIERGLTVFGFDPTIDEENVRSVFQSNHHKDNIPTEFHFKQLGLAATDGVVTFFQSKNPKVRSKTAVALDGLKANYKDGGFQAAVLQLKTFMCMFEHQWLQVLKMDVEGVELDVCLSEAFRNWQVPADQILIEFHERLLKGGNAKKRQCVDVLMQKGYKAVHTSSNRQEVAFARMGPSSKVIKP